MFNRIETYNDCKRVDYYVNCFERGLTLIFRGSDWFNNKEIYDSLEKSYDEWQEDDKGYCCEEYLIEKLPTIYKNNLLCVVYGEEE